MQALAEFANLYTQNILPYTLKFLQHVYFTASAVVSSRIKFYGWGILPLKFSYLTHVYTHQVCLVMNFHGLNFHCGSFNREIHENYMPRTFPGIWYSIQLNPSFISFI